MPQSELEKLNQTISRWESLEKKDPIKEAETLGSNINAFSNLPEDDIGEIIRLTREKRFVEPKLHQPEMGTALDVIDAKTGKKPAIWENIPQDIRDRLKDNKQVFKMPSGRTVDPVTKKALGVLLAPPTSFITGIQSGGEKVKEGIEAIGSGDFEGGTFAIINGLGTSGFAALTPFVPVLAGFSIANKVAEDAGLGEEMETFMAPFSKTFEDQVANEIRRLKSEGKTTTQISKQLGLSPTAVKEEKSIAGQEIAETADMIFNLALFGKTAKVGKTLKSKIAESKLRNNKGRFQKPTTEAETPQLKIQPRETKPVPGLTQEKLPLDLAKGKLEV